MSGVWNFFKREGRSSAKCLLCNKSYSTGGGTSNLRQHLEAKHPTAFATLNSKINPKSLSLLDEEPSKKLRKTECSGVNSDVQIIDADILETGTRECASPKEAAVNSPKSPKTARCPSTPTAAVTPTRQMTIVESAHMIESFRSGGQRSSQLEKALLFMVARDALPHSIVDKEGFQYFSQVAVPLWKPPSRNTVTKHSELKYIVVRDFVKETLAKIEAVSITADLCTITNSTRSFIVVTAHYIDESIENISLAVHKLEPHHTGVNICKEVESVLAEFGIDKEKIVSFATDGAANIKLACALLVGKEKHVYCFAHLLQLVVNDGLQHKDNTVIQHAIKLVKEIVTYSKQNNDFSDLLRIDQMKDGIPEGQVKTLDQELKTRWNSLYKMLKKFIELSPYIARLCHLPRFHNCPPMLNNDEMAIIQDLVDVLRPFLDATTEISGSQYVTGSLVIPLVALIDTRLHLVSPKTSCVKLLKAQLIQSVEFRLHPYQNSVLLAKATFLDPRFKKMYIPALVATMAINIISSELKEGMTHAKEPTQLVQSKTASSSLWQTHQSNLETMGSDTYTDQLPPQLKLYIQQPVVSLSENPIQFWLKSKPLLPLLSKIALNTLTVIGSSVASERLVSSVNFIVSDDKSRLTNRHINERIFLANVPKNFWKFD